MKTWNDLTKEEKEKLSMIYTIANYQSKHLLSFIYLSFLAVFIGIPLIFVPYIPLMLAGFLLLILGFYLIIVAVFKTEKFEKKVKLIFDVDDIYEDIFEIKESDIKNIKKKWVKTK